MSTDNTAERTKVNEQEAMDVLEQEKRNVDRLLSMNYIRPDNGTLAPTAGGFASLHFEDKDYPRVTFYRAFPFTMPDAYISVREPDEKAREIGIIEKLSDWDETTRSLIESQLALRYFMPTITKILSIKEEYGYAYWSVLTDKGPCKFTISAGSGSVVHLSDTHVIVRDIDENRYDIPDLSRLSQKELKRVDLYV